MSRGLEIEYLDCRFTAMLDTRETGRVDVTGWQLDSISRGKTVEWIMFDRFLTRNDFADEDAARANIVDWLGQRVGPHPVPRVEVTAANAATAGAIPGDEPAAELSSARSSSKSQAIWTGSI
ncbi:hypothetical protein LGM65_14985 [Burkholderia anthina]|uniref:hypothetical protein n=1 Tax=Burkholderia anthina TaxID=179879 RepID=UPI001CF5E55F|nr:hypothetical protein [Burkholderia anthina]MCA8092178.1 hypothetical protein [Burkholderia anthina]